MNKYRISLLPIDILKKTALEHKQLRKQLKYTQVDLAERSGVSLGSIKRFEQTGKISFESLLSLAHILGRLDSFKNLFSLMEDFSRIEKLFSDKTRQ